jgi:GNAT superfamily N-acetyltransferase
MPATQVPVIRTSNVREFRDNAFSLLYAHWKEVALNQSSFPLAPDWERYELLEKQGSLIALAAWNGKTMIAYSVTVLHRPLHYTQNLSADNDVLYVNPAYRNSSLGKRLMKDTEAAAKKAGADLITWHAKKDTPLERVLERRGSGYVVHDIIFSKEI